MKIQRLFTKDEDIEFWVIPASGAIRQALVMWYDKDVRCVYMGCDGEHKIYQIYSSALTRNNRQRLDRVHAAVEDFFRTHMPKMPAKLPNSKQGVDA